MNKKYAVVLALVLFLLSVAQSQDITELDTYQATKVVIVSATQAWTSTAIDLQANDRVEIKVSGIASTWGTNVQKTYWYGPDGNGWAGSAHPFPSAGGFAVIGKLGTSGTPFLVGSIRSFISKVAGSLYLGYNDNQLSDNYGYFVAFITVIRNGAVITNIANPGENRIESFLLEQNYPNPFNPSTTIQYALPKTENVDVRIYNAAGQLVKTIATGEREAGQHSAVWDGRDDTGNSVSSGAYFYQVKAGDFLQAKKMLLIK